jgi:microcystin synthetase protein McyE
MSQTPPAHDYRDLLAKALAKLDRMQARIDSFEQAASEPIAIVGMACRFPGGVDSPALFWERLIDGFDAVRDIPKDRWDVDAFYDPDPRAPGKISSRRAALLDAIDSFDARFFSISRREAESMDPQQRLLLEVAWHALEHANQPALAQADRPLGIFVGLCGADHAMAMYKGGYTRIDSFFGTGNAASVAAGRLAFFLGATGPAVTIDTACSSAMVALHQACASLRRSECRAALVAAVNVILDPAISIALTKANMLSPGGRCRTFDAAADGYVRGEGCGALILKRLSDAIADGDRILATVRGSAVNQDGASGGLTMPSGPAQQRLLRTALGAARLLPEQIDYVEAHGTGTPLGDPIECNALGAVYQVAARKEPLRIGSVKTNLGHLETAAGMAGIIKTVLALQHGVIPPHLHLQQPSSHIDWAGLGLHVPRTVEPWPRTDGPRRAGVSSFGFSGTNAHVLLEQAPPARLATPTALPAGDHVLVLSAKGQPALRALADRYVSLLATLPETEVAALCATAARGRAALPDRLAVVGASGAELHRQLTDWQKGQTAHRAVLQGRVKDGAGAAPVPSAAELQPLTAAVLAQRFVAGESIDWNRHHEGHAALSIDAPLYPFQRESFRSWSPPEPAIAAPPSTNASKEPFVQERSVKLEGPSPLSPSTDSKPAPQSNRPALLGQLRQLLAELLREKPDQMATDDSFLNQGADSIILADFARRIEQAFGVEIDMSRLFEDLDTLDKLSTHLESQREPVSASSVTEPVAAGPGAPDLRSLPEEPQVLIDALRTSPIAARASAPDGEFLTYRTALVSLTAVVAAYLERALSELGLDLTVGRHFSIDKLHQQLPLAARYQVLLPRFLKTLAAEGILRRVGDGFERTDAVAIDPKRQLATLTAQLPVAAAELSLLGRCGEGLAAVLRGQAHPLEVLFPHGDTTAAERVYADGPVARMMNELIAEAAVRLLPRGGRLLEVGAGTGATTRALLARRDLQATQIVVSDLSPYLLAQARRSWGGRPGLDVRQLDLEQDPQAQGFSAQSYDVIVAANVLHATRDLRETVGHLRQLLTPGGSLLLLETVEQRPWLDVTFALTEGWWRFRDHDLRPDSPLLTSMGWRSLLQRAGFALSASLAESGLPTPTGQDLIIARNLADSVPLASAAPVVPAAPPAQTTAIDSSAKAPTAAIADGVQAVLLAQLQSLQDLRSLYETTVSRQLDLLRGGSVQPPLSPPLPLPQSASSASSLPPKSLPPKSLPTTAEQAAIAQPAAKSRARLDRVVGANLRAVTRDERRPLTPQQQAFIRDLAARYNRKTANSKSYAERGRAVLADWINTIDFRLAIKELQYPIVSEWSQGAYFRDIDDNTYLDLAMGFGANFFGHNPPFVVEALRNQMAQGMELATQSKLAATVAQQIQALTGAERVSFSNTGTEAIMHALRIARARNGRPKIALFAGSYHGTFDGILAGSDASGRQTVATSTGTPPGMVEDVLVLTYDSPDALARIREHGDEISAVLVEPVQSRKPSLQPREFLHQLRALTTELDIALIFDEMITGFRIAPGGAQEWFDVRADMVLYGKAIGGGLPISIVAGRAKYLDYVDGGQWQFGDESYPRVDMTTFGGTFCRHPLALAACHAVLTHLQTEGPVLQQRVRQRADRLAADLNATFASLGVPIRLAHFGPLLRFEPYGAYSVFLNPIEMPLFYYLLNHAGIYTWERRVSFLSTEHTDQDCARIVSEVRKAVLELQRHGFFSEGGPGGKPGGPGGAKAGPERPPSTERTLVTPGPAPAEVRAERCPTSESQRQLWILAELDPQASAAFNISASLQLRGPLVIPLLQESLRQVMQRHDALRTQITDSGEAQQTVAAPPLSWTLHDLRALPSAARQQQADALRRQFIGSVFDLAAAPLFAALLLRLDDQDHLLTVKTHHIIADGWSIELILREIGELYSAASEGRATTLAEPRSFVTHLVHRRRELAIDDPHRAFWLAQYADPLPTQLDLPFDALPTSTKSYAGARQTRRLGGALIGALKALGRRNGASLFMTLFAAYTALLHRLSGQSDLAIGIPIIGRDGENEKAMVGFCSQLLPVRMRLDGTLPFVAHLVASKRTLLDAFRHQSFAYADLRAAMEGLPSAAAPPTLHVTFNMDPQLDVPTFTGLGGELVEEPITHTAFDLGFNLIDLDGELIAYCNYNADLFHAATVGTFLGYFETLLQEVLRDEQQPVQALPLLCDSDRPALTDALIGPPLEFSHDATIVHYVREQVAATPERTAVVAGSARLSYRQLDAASDHLACLLRELHAIKPGDRVAMLLNRHEGIPIAVLAIFKVGAIYVPLDPGYPRTRLAYLLSDSGARLCISESALAAQLPESCPHLLYDRLPTTESLPGAQAHPPLPPNDLAYIFYTSGSTGQPKGVVGRHQSIVNVLLGLRQRFGLAAHPGWRYLFTAAVTHDPSLRHIFLPLICGGEVHVYQLRDAHHLLDYVRSHAIDALHTTPTVYRELLRELGDEVLTEPSYVSIGGEALDRATALRLVRHFPRATVSNVYGATETCVGVSQYVLRPDLDRDPPLGEVFANHQLLVLDSQGRMAEPYTCGEICVSGPGLAAGYHGRPDLTEQRFVDHPLRPGTRMYRTGDRGQLRRGPGGWELRFAGRLDDQLKLRGYRIEPAEVVQALCDFPQIRSAAVDVVGEGDDRLLVAWIEAPETVEMAAVREQLRLRLPSYLIPARLLRLSTFPRTAHGKLDRRALPNPTAPSDVRVPPTAPRNPVEARIVTLWAQLLRTEETSISVYADFFDLGGQSLHAARVVSALHRDLGVHIKLAAFFAQPTVAHLARLVQHGQRDGYEPIPQLPPRPHDPLSRAQRRLWVLEQLDPQGLAYAMPSAYLFTGPLDQAAFSAAFSDLVERHHILRTTFTVVDGETRQRVGTGHDFAVTRQDLTAYADPEAVARELARRDLSTPFDLERGPLLRVQLLALGESRHVVLFNAHHIIFDGWSAGVLIRDFLQFYDARGRGQAAPLPPLPIQYRDYSDWHNRRVNSGQLAGERRYWLSQLSPPPARLQLPSQRARPAVQSYAGGCCELALGDALIQPLHRLSRAHGASLFMGLVALVKALLFRITGQREITVGAPIAGRNHPDLEQQIGFYVNMLVLRNQLAADETLATLIDRVRTTTTAAYDHQEYPFDLILEDLALRRDPSRTPLFDIAVVLQNNEDVALSLAGIDVAPFRQEVVSSKFDLRFNFVPDGSGIRLELEFNSTLFDRAHVINLLAAFQRLAAAAVAAPETALRDLSLLPPAAPVGEAEASLFPVDFNF